MLQKYKNGNIIYENSNQLVSYNNINSNATALFKYKNELVSANSIYNYEKFKNITTIPGESYTLFSYDYNNTVMTMQVIIYHTVIPGYRNINIENKFDLYIDDELFESVTLLPNIYIKTVYIFNRRFEIYKDCKNIKMILTTNYDYELSIHNIQVHSYVL